MKQNLIERMTNAEIENVKGGIWIIGEDGELYWVDFDEGEGDLGWD